MFATVPCAPAAIAFDFTLYGFAATGSGTTGGAGGATVTATTLDQLRTFCGQEGPLVIRVQGTIIGNEAIPVASNKSIVGAPGAHLVGLGFTIGRSSQFGQVGNVIIRNLVMEKPLAPIDKVVVQYGAHHVWIDHNEFFSDLDHGVDFYDGQVDITQGADFVTVSWNVFHDHFKNSLVGNSENAGREDNGHLRVTYHHNLFTRVDGRNPSIRFGTAHVYNNHYLNVRDYGIASRQNAQVRVENNYFDTVATPIRADTSLSAVPGFVSQVSTNVFANCGPNSITTPAGNFLPPYDYPLDPAASVPSIVQQGAGVGKVTFAAAPPRQTESDEYTRYELLAPGSGRFHIVYEVTATTPGATRFFNPIRKGSAASDEAVRDRKTGRPLPFRVVSGTEAKAGGVAEAEADGRFIAVELPRPVPADGEVRLLIEKTYEDPKSYFVEGDRIVFSRSLGIKRNAVVLPAGYEVVACNVPVQVLMEDGRVVVSLVNTMPGEAAVVIKGRKLP